MNAAALTEQTREMAAFLVEREMRQHGSRMLAYDTAGRLVGASGAWMRKFIKQYSDVKLDLFVGLSIYKQYRRLCERIEQEAEAERAKLIALLRNVDATTEGALGMVDVETSEKAGGKVATRGEGMNDPT